mgnify:FL=1|tara:strand:- start:41 stop:2509 length:2469 start_codon:yes stop_codon:yes gene_type:complete
MGPVKFILSFCISFTILIGSTIEISVSGTVIRENNNAPLEGANVVFVSEGGEEFGASTDVSGKFNLNNLPSGKYNVTISFIGFQDYKENIILDDNKTYTINASLNIQPIIMAKLEIISDSNLPYDELPGTSTVLDIKTIRTIDPVGTQEMLELIPGINGYADDGFSNSRLSIGIRGLNPRRSSRVLILEDGIPIQPALYVYPNMYYNPPSERIDRVEVIKGSGAIKFGPQTMGGVINYYTRRPRNDFGGRLNLKAGENGYSSIFAEFGGWRNKKFKPEVQVLFKRGDGFRENNNFQQVNGTFKLNYLKSPDENIFLKANFNFEDSNATYTGLTKFSFDKDPKFNPKKDDNFKLFRTAVDLINTKRINSRFSKSTTAFVSYFDRRWWRENDIFISASDLNSSNPTIQPYYNTGNLIRTGNGKDNFGILRTFYVFGLQQAYTLDRSIFGYQSRLEFGGRVYWERFIDDKQSGSNTDSRSGIYYIPAATDKDKDVIVGQSHHYETTAFSGFISESVDVNGFQVRPGLRFEIFEQERVDRLNGSLYQDKTLYVLLPGIGFSKNIFGLQMFGGIHRGFTPPSSGALKILSFGSNSKNSGLDLEAEKSWNKELGLRGDISIINFEASAFHIGIENLVAAGRGTAFKNLGKVNSVGLELNALLSLSKSLKILPDFHLSYTYLKTAVVDGRIISNVSGKVGSEVSIKDKELPYAPRHTLTTGISGNYFNSFSFRLDFRYVSKVYTDFENIEVEDNLGISGPISAYTFINLSADYQINSNYRIYFSGKNITDQVYIGSRLHSNPGQPQAHLSSGILPGPRRQINIGFEYLF